GVAAAARPPPRACRRGRGRAGRGDAGPARRGGADRCDVLCGKDPARARVSEIPVHRSGASPRPAAGAVDRNRGPRGLLDLLPSADGGRPAVFRTPLPARAGPRGGSPPRPSGGPPRSVPAAPPGGLTPPPRIRRTGARPTAARLHSRSV